jgi:hypothetical protein
MSASSTRPLKPEKVNSIHNRERERERERESYLHIREREREKEREREREIIRTLTHFESESHIFRNKRFSFRRDLRRGRSFKKKKKV